MTRIPRQLRELPRLGSGIGLHRLVELCREVMGDPWFTELDAVSVIGSNGRGR